MGLNLGSTICCSVTIGKLLNRSVPQFLYSNMRIITVPV